MGTRRRAQRLARPRPSGYFQWLTRVLSFPRLVSLVRQGLDVDGSKRRLHQVAQRQPFTLLASAAIAGIALKRFLPLGLVLCILVSIASLLILTGWFLSRRRDDPKNQPDVQSQGRRRGRTFPAMLTVLLLFASMSAIRQTIVQTQYQSASLLKVLSIEEEPTVLVGIVDQPVRVRRDPMDAMAATFDLASFVENDSVGMDINPSRSEQQAAGRRQSDAGTYQTMLVVRVETLRRGFTDVTFSGRTMVMVDGQTTERLLPGDRVRLRGHIRSLTEPTNPGERDRRSWAHRQKLHAMMRVRSVDQVERLGNANTTFFTIGERWIANLAASARETILAHVGEQQDGLALALVLGQRDLLDQRASESLLVTGTAHLLSVSGLHLGIIVLLARVMGSVARLPRRGQIALLIAVASFYVAITGGRPPVLRAAILLSTLILSSAFGRSYHPLNSLSVAAFLLAAWMPEEVFGIGIQLSFLAVATLLMCGSPNTRGNSPASQARQLEQQFDELVDQSRSPWARWSRWLTQWALQALWYSGCVTVITMPLVWQQFHVVSPISVMVNVILSPLMALALSAGVTTVLAGWCFPPLAQVTGWFCSVILSLMEWLIELARSVPWGHHWLPTPPTGWIVTYYFGVLALLVVVPMGRRRWPIATWSCLWMASAWWMATTPPALPSGSLETTFVNVGHGTAAIIRPNRDEVWLYDCGWLGNARGTSRNIDTALWALGTTHIDGVFLSHADADHFNALPGLADRFSIGVVVTPPKMLAGDGRVLATARKAIERLQLPVVEMHQGKAWPDEDSHAEWTSPEWFDAVRVLHPPARLLDASDNANSLVVQINHAGRCLLLPGDLEPPGTSVLTNLERPLPGGVMMAPHHGSLRMDAEHVLQWARPREIVVSGGKRARQPEVTNLLSAAGGEVFVTASEGAVRVRVGSNGQVEMRTWRKSPW